MWFKHAHGTSLHNAEVVKLHCIIERMETESLKCQNCSSAAYIKCSKRETGQHTDTATLHHRVAVLTHTQSITLSNCTVTDADSLLYLGRLILQMYKLPTYKHESRRQHLPCELMLRFEHDGTEGLKSEPQVFPRESSD